MASAILENDMPFARYSRGLSESSLARITSIRLFLSCPVRLHTRIFRAAWRARLFSDLNTKAAGGLAGRWNHATNTSDIPKSSQALFLIFGIAIASEIRKR